MTERERDGIDFEVEEALDDRWTSEPSHLDRVLFYLVLATLGAALLVESTGHMEPGPCPAAGGAERNDGPGAAAEPEPAAHPARRMHSSRNTRREERRE